FKWDQQDDVISQINHWWQRNKAEGRFSVLGAYALGKAQRILANVDSSIGPILTHGAIENTNEVLRAQGITLPDTVRVTQDLNAKNFPGALVLATPAGMGGPWVRRFADRSTAFASGWMSMRGVRRRRAADRGFVMSDHADWEGLNSAIVATGAERVFVTHGYTSIFSRWLKEEGYDAHIVETEFEGEGLETPEGADEQEADQ
ncbi:MAG: DNA ligase-associated DEXH box helicase, partial [Litoreibacter sp.]|nr:DNA ligase-associated DEXH box helicase [Litoreibacter sp.]